MTPREMAESALRHEHDDIKGLAHCLLEALDEIERLRADCLGMLEHGGYQYMDDCRRKAQQEADRMRYTAEAIAKERDAYRAIGERLRAALRRIADSH
jgi:hypothetical protein